MSLFNSLFNTTEDTEEAKAKKIKRLLYIEILLGICLVLITMFIIMIVQ